MQRGSDYTTSKVYMKSKKILHDHTILFLPESVSNSPATISVCLASFGGEISYAFLATFIQLSYQDRSVIVIYPPKLEKNIGRSLAEKKKL